MNKSKLLFLLSLFTCVFTQFAFAQQTTDIETVPTQEQYSRVKIYTNEQGLAELSAMGVEIDHGEYKKGVWFTSDFSASDIKKMEQAGFSYDIVHKDVVAHYTSAERAEEHHHAHYKKTGCAATEGGETTEYLVPSNFELGSMAGFFTYEEMLEHLDNMATKFPNLITVKEAIGDFKTHEDNVLHWVKISDSPYVDEEEPEVLYTALHHAREPASLSQMIFYMYYLLENYERDPNIKYLVDNTEMYFIPCINPDGYQYNQLTNPNGGGMWRRNANDNDGNGSFNPSSDGVDLNRNYDWEWGRDNNGSSPDQSSDTYRGSAPFSEPETQAVQFFCNAHDFQIALNYHSFSDLLIYPWGYVADLYTPDSALYVNYAQIMTQENNYLAGTANQTVGYLVNGDSDDWMYGEQTTKNKTFTFTPEVGSPSDGFWPAAGRIITLCQENVWANIATASLVHNYARVADTSPLFVDKLQSGFSFKLTRIGLQDDVPFTLSIEATNDAIISTSASQSYTLNSPLEFLEGAFVYELRPGIADGDLITFDVLIDNHQGSIERTSITKYFGAPAVVLDERADDLDAWTSDNWGLSTTEYYSSTSSITDSPGDTYPPGSSNQLSLNKRIDLNDCTVATLSFWAKWDIETAYDYVQIFAVNSDTGVETPLCGNYTTMGNSYLDDDQPLYDGTQNDWVKEEISLNEFIGQKITLRFYFWSDQFVEGDGFYFDDLTVSKLGGIETAISDFQVNPNILLGQNSPNPTDGWTTFSFAVPNSLSSLELATYNTLGQEVNRQNISSTNKGNIQLDTSTFQNGVYFSRLESHTGTSNVVRLTVLQ